MKSTLFKALIIGAIAVGASVPVFAQTSGPWLEQWYRDKFGRPLPAAVVQQNSKPNAEPAAAARAAGATAAPVNSWLNTWYRDKFGRPSPLEQTHPEQSPKLFKASKQTEQRPVNTWFEQWYHDKYGRPSPQEESRRTPRTP